MTKRERIKQKYNGKCAYSGTELEWDWQIDHIKPVIRDSFCKVPLFKDADTEANCVPCQKAINQYKHAYELETFRGLLMTLHKRIKPTPRTPERIARKKRLMKVAGYFGITAEKPFDGIFYFETRR